MSSVQGYCATFIFTVSWPLLGFNENFGVGEDVMNRWKGSSNPQTYWQGQLGADQDQLSLLFHLEFWEEKRDRVSSNTPSHDFLLGVDIVWPFFHDLSYPRQGCHLHSLRSTTNSQSAPGGSKFLFFFVLDLYRQACLEEKNVSLGRRWFEKVPALP